MPTKTHLMWIAGTLAVVALGSYMNIPLLTPAVAFVTNKRGA